MVKTIKRMNELNPDKKIIPVSDESFSDYGTIHKSFKIDRLRDYIHRNNIVKDEVVYNDDVLELKRELSTQLDPIMNSIYGGLGVQVGVCYGRNAILNGLEFHQGSEVYINNTDMILMLGLEKDIKWPEGIYDSSLIKFFYAPAGLVIELKGGCMHWVAVNVYESKGINVIVSLLKDTNSSINFQPDKSGKDKLIIAKNTWFLAHLEYESTVESGWHMGIKGKNYIFKTL